jgi:hypothetical protein
MRKPTLYQSLRAKRRSQSMVIGLTWYTADTWAQVKATATDPECFEESFDKWKAMAVPPPFVATGRYGMPSRLVNVRGVAPRCRERSCRRSRRNR